MKFASHQPLEHKLGVIRTLRHRANITVSNYKDKTQEDNHLKKVLSLAGYPKWPCDKPAVSSKAVPTRGKRSVKGHVTLPYVQGVTESLAHILRTADIMVHMCQHKKIRVLLVAPKDPTDKMEQARVIYAVKCGGCDSGYVGETSRPLKKRIMEYQRDSSPLSQHANDSGHPVNYDQVKVLDWESGWFRRGVKESIHILASTSDLNRDRGRYTLPRVYHTLLHSEAAGSSCSATSE